MGQRRGWKPPITGDRQVDLAFQDLVRLLGEMEDRIVAGEVVVYAGSGGGSGGGGGTTVVTEGMTPLSGATIQIYEYDPDNPTSPSTLLGTETTNGQGQWWFDIVNDGGKYRPTFVTVKVDGVIRSPNPWAVGGHFAQKSDGSWVPNYIGGIEYDT